MRSKTLEVVGTEFTSSERSRTFSSRLTGKQGSGSISYSLFRFRVLTILDTANDDWEEKHQEHSKNRMGGSCFATYYGFGHELLSGYLRRKRLGKEKIFNHFARKMIDHGKETESKAIEIMNRYRENKLEKCDKTYVGEIHIDNGADMIPVLCSPDIITKESIYEIKCHSPVVAERLGHESTQSWKTHWLGASTKPLCSAFVQACMYAIAFNKVNVYTVHCFSGLVTGETIVYMVHYRIERSDSFRIQLFNDAKKFLQLREDTEPFDSRKINQASRSRGEELNKMRIDRFCSDNTIYLQE